MCCVASLEGYRSETKPLADVNPNSGTKLGKMFAAVVLGHQWPDQPADEQASKNAKKAFQKGLDEAAKQEWTNAMASLQKATAASPGYSSAWLSLGILQQSGRDLDGARNPLSKQRKQMESLLSRGSGLQRWTRREAIGKPLWIILRRRLTSIQQPFRTPMS